MKIDKVNDEFIVDCTNNSKEEIQEVYKFLVDNRDYSKWYLETNSPIIVCNKKDGDSNWVTLTQYYNWYFAKKDIPVYTFEEFKKMYLDKFSLPVKWCVKDCKKVTEYGAKRFHHKMGDILEDTYLCIDESSGEYNYLKEKYNYIEITLEQFEKYVLNKNNMETKKIIGYKLIKPEYKEVICLIGKWDSIKTFEKIENGYNLSTKSYHYDLLRNAGVLDIWFEPVYEEEFKVGDWVTFWSEIDKKLYSSKIKEWTPHNYCKLENGLEPFKHLIKKATPEEIEKASKTIVKMYSSNKGEFEIEVLDGKAYYRPEDKELPKEFIEVIIKSFKDEDLSFGGRFPYSIKTKTFVNVGCMHNTKREDWEKVYKLLK